jgi:hypothetical protein
MGQNLGFIYTRTHLWRQDQEAKGGLADEGGFAAPIILVGTRSGWPVLQGLRGKCAQGCHGHRWPGHHGWNVPVVGCLRVRYLSKLEQDTMRLH